MSKALAILRQNWNIVEVVERTTGPIKRDFAGFGDIICSSPKHLYKTPMVVQVTSASNFANRLKKVREHENLKYVLEDFRVCVMGFRKGSSTPHRVEFVE